MTNTTFAWLRNLLLAAAGLAATMAAPIGALAQAPAADLKHVFTPYQQLLERHLVERELPDGGLISAFEYRDALASDLSMALLDSQRSWLARFDPDTLDARAQALAFWVNVYNFFMLDYLLSNPQNGRPADSVRDYGSFLNKYKLFERELFDVGGREYALQEIELEVLLGDEFAERGWKDARVHFMVNCASVGCPPLRAQIYTAENVDAMLAENTRLALDTPLHLERDGNTLRVTSLFDWYADDFIEQNGSVRGFIREHGSERARAHLEAAETIEFIDYDWSLNSPANFDRVLKAAGVEPFAIETANERE